MPIGDNDLVTTPTRAPKVDSVCAAAVDVARTALDEAVGANQFGDHLGTVAEAERVVTHYFAAVTSGYTGWRWAVTVTRAPRQKVVTVNEIVMLPGEGALTAPEWLPWRDRVAPGDLGPGDLLPVSDDDPRLVPGYTAVADEADAHQIQEVTREVGLGRERVLSADGRELAATRWYDGSYGSDDAQAQVAPAHCGSCGFLVRLAGPLSHAFGVCANGFSPGDGHVVSFDYGCGAHSDVRAEQITSAAVMAGHAFDTVGWDDAEAFTR